MSEAALVGGATGTDRSNAAVLRRARLRRALIASSFLLPALALIVVYRIYPIGEAIRLSLTDWDGIGEPAWLGLGNYRELAGDERFRAALLVNARLLLAIPALVVIPFVVAALLQSRVPGWQIFRSVYFIPTLLSPVVIGLAFKILLKEDGMVNTLLRAVGLDGFTRVWLKDTTWALVWIVIIAGWSVLGTGVVIFLAAMGTVDPSLLEAARIDGANWWQVQRHVVFWQILPIIELWTVLLLMAMLGQFFPMILLMTTGGPDYTTTTADLYAYQQAFQYFRSGYASAANVIMVVITVALVGLTLAAFRRSREV